MSVYKVAFGNSLGGDVLKCAYRVGRAGAHACHNGNQDVLLDREATGVERDTKDLDLRDNTGPETENRERNQLRHNLKHS